MQVEPLHIVCIDRILLDSIILFTIVEVLTPSISNTVFDCRYLLDGNGIDAISQVVGAQRDTGPVTASSSSTKQSFLSLRFACMMFCVSVSRGGVFGQGEGEEICVEVFFCEIKEPKILLFLRC